MNAHEHLKSHDVSEQVVRVLFGAIAKCRASWFFSNYYGYLDRRSYFSKKTRKSYGCFNKPNIDTQNWQD
jgi:hypothetical protein